MTRFIKKFLIFSFILLVFALFTSHAIDKGLRKTRYVYYGEWNDLYNSRINADLIILGSSRARQHFSTQILDSALKLYSYNLGMEAYRFQLQYNVFKIYLKHNRKPKFIIFSLDSYTLHEDKNPYYYQQFLPYLYDPMIWKAFKGYKHEFTGFDRYIPLFKYKGEKTQIIVGLKEFLSIEKYPDNAFKGFYAYNIPWDGTFEKFKLSQPGGSRQTIDQADVDEFESFLTYCKQEGISTYLVYSPEYLPAQKLCSNRDSIIRIYQQYAVKYGAHFIDFSDDPISSDKSKFYNSQHMNFSGSEQFSRKLAGLLKSNNSF